MIDNSDYLFMKGNNNYIHDLCNKYPCLENTILNNEEVFYELKKLFDNWFCFQKIAIYKYMIENTPYFLTIKEIEDYKEVSFNKEKYYDLNTQIKAFLLQTLRNIPAWSVESIKLVEENIDLSKGAYEVLLEEINTYLAVEGINSYLFENQRRNNMIDKLKEDFPSHNFDVNSTEMFDNTDLPVIMYQLKIDNKPTNINWSIMEKSILDKSLEEDAGKELYNVVKHYVENFLNKGE